jgi:hypothetical protein
MPENLSLPTRPQTREEALADDPLRNYFVWWDDIVQKDVDELAYCVNAAKKEQEVQLLLERKPLLLIQHFGGGHGRWVIPQKRLGSEHITDFIIGEEDSMGFNWVAVELEKPSNKLFTEKGDPTARLNHSYRQITDWRTWLKNNIDYARRLPEKEGMGLTDIDGDCSGLIIIGRRANTDKNTTQRLECQDTHLRLANRAGSRAR